MQFINPPTGMASPGITNLSETSSSSIGRVRRWLFNDPELYGQLSPAEARRIDWMRAGPFLLLHGLVLLIPVVGVSPVAVAFAVGLYLVRMFLVTAVFHRYFSHRSYRLSRGMQFILAVLACTAGQRGPLWWAGHHREHHVESDTPQDPHSPRQHGRWYSHALWFLTRGSFATPTARVKDWTRYPELRWLEAFDWLPFVGLGAACAAAGWWLQRDVASLGTSASQMFVWGFAVSTVLLYHATYTINSLAHGWGSRRFDTDDDSRNNPLLALITLGEGWHNNHHHYPASARMGFYWWEVDLTHLGLRGMETVGLASDLRPVPGKILRDGRGRDALRRRQRRETAARRRAA